MTFYSLILVVIVSCDPVNRGEIINKSDEPVDIIIHASDSDIGFYQDVYELNTLQKASTIRLLHNDKIIVGFGNGIAASVTQNDLRLDSVDIIKGMDTLSFDRNALFQQMKKKSDCPYFAIYVWSFRIK